MALDGVEDVLIDRETGEVNVKCAEGAELTEAQVTEAIEADDRFEVTEFAMHAGEAAPEAAPEEDGQ
ncbi:hypothetical protein OT109_05990 [Phycisphaeraceae bacterium D3-23]